jgi:chromate reductase, NAD(P)H dehydrogenase (quinone)
MAKLLLISGSMRGGSTNSATLQTAAALAPAGVEAEIYDGIGRLPHFSPDDDPADGVGLDAEVAVLRASLGGADAVLLSTPEYAGALPGSFKNMLDWTVGGGQAYEMPVAWINVSGAAAPSGGTDAHESLRKVLGFTGARIVEEAVLRLPLGREDIGEDGLITPPEARERIVEAVEALAAAAGGRGGGEPRLPT